MSYQVQDACSHTAMEHMFYHILCPNQSLTTRVTQVVFGSLLLIGGIFAIYSFIANRSSTPASPKTSESEQAVTKPSSSTIPDVSKQAITEPVSPKKIDQATESRSTQPTFKVSVGTFQPYDYNDAGHLDKSMAGKKISDIQDIETILRLFPNPTYEETRTKAYVDKQKAFSFVSNEVLSTFLENSIDDTYYLIECFFSTKQFHAIDIEKVPLSNLETILFKNNFSFFCKLRYDKFNVDQRAIIESRLQTHLKKFKGFEHLK
jgi:hypothetical protein